MFADITHSYKFIFWGDCHHTNFNPNCRASTRTLAFTNVIRYSIEHCMHGLSRFSDQWNRKPNWRQLSLHYSTPFSVALNLSQLGMSLLMSKSRRRCPWNIAVVIHGGMKEENGKLLSSIVRTWDITDGWNWVVPNHHHFHLPWQRNYSLFRYHNLYLHRGGSID